MPAVLAPVVIVIWPTPVVAAGAPTATIAAVLLGSTFVVLGFDPDTKAVVPLVKPSDAAAMTDT
jgi:hypothetical protein